MGLGAATTLAALFVLIRFPWVLRWLKTNAQLGKRTVVALPAVMLCAALTLLHPVLLRWEIQRGMRGEGGFEILTMMTLTLLQGWFVACVAAFWQVALYPAILRAWAHSRQLGVGLRRNLLAVGARSEHGTSFCS